MKKILVLGGAQAQVPLIEAAKKEGYYVVLCDWTTTNPGIALADKHYQVSTLDYEAVIEVAKIENIDGVISNSEPAMVNVAKISTVLGLVGNTSDAVECLQSKYLFRKLQDHSGVFAPKAFESSDINEFLNNCVGLSFPIIVKPSKSSGSRGTTKVDLFEEKVISQAFMECKEFSSNQKVTCEEFVEMPSNSNIEADVFVYGNTIIWNGLFSNIRSPLFPALPQTYVFPSTLTELEIEHFKKVVEHLLRMANFQFGEINVEAYFTKKNELFIVEINARQGGNRIPQLIQDYCGIDMYKLLVTTAVGDDFYLMEITNKISEKNFITNYVVFPEHEGMFEGYRVAEEVIPYLYYQHDSAVSGKPVRKAQNSKDAVGMVTFGFPTREEQLHFSNNLSHYIEVQIKR